MLAFSLFSVVPVALVLVASTTPSSASPTVVRHRAMQNKTKLMTTARTGIAPTPRRTRAKHVVIESRSVDDTVAVALNVCLGQLSSSHDRVRSTSNAFTAMAKKPHSKSAHDSSYQQDCAAGLSSFRHSLDPLQGILEQLGPDKGLANYDKHNQYEVLLKEIVNYSKCTLSDVDAIIATDPILGPILGPIVYEIKCIIDDLLDVTENVTDGLLNSLTPLLGSLNQDATSTVCRSIAVAGLCLPV